MYEEKKYCFTDQEFRILAAWAGITNLYGFLGSGEEMLDDKTIHRLLFGMVKKSFLCPGPEGYVLQDGVRQLFEQIKEADSVVTCSSGGNIPNQCIYLAEKIVVVEEDGLNDRIVKVRGVKQQDIIYELLESMQLEDEWEAVVRSGREEDGTVWYPEAGLVQCLETVIDQKRMEILSKEADILIELEYWDKQKETVTWKIWRISMPLYDILLCRQEDRTEAYPYSVKRLVDLMREMMGTAMGTAVWNIPENQISILEM